MERDGMENTTELVWLYVKRRPFIKEVLREGVVNHSALARKICAETGIRRQNAVKMALVRMGGKLGKTEEDLEGRILGVLRKSSMVIRSKVAVVIARRELEGVKPLSFVKSGRHVTYIMDQRELEGLPGKSLWKSEENLNLITIESPQEIEEVPGVISHILGALASEGINVVEFISCYTDTLLVVRQADTEMAYRILSLITG
jgi:hypothetical protein